MTLEQIEKAAFWDHGFCLDCSAEIDPNTTIDHACPECGSTEVYSAHFLLRVWSWMTSE